MPTPQDRDAARRAQQPVFTALVLLVCTIAALVAAGVFASWRIYSLANKRFIDQAAPVFAVTEDALVEMLNEETGVRGYVITANPTTLEPYEQGLKFEKLELALLAKDKAFDPQIPAHLAAFRHEVNVLDVYFAREVALVKSGPAGQKRAQAETLAGKSDFDRLRKDATALYGDAGRVIARSHGEQHGTLIDSFAFLGTAGAIAMVMAVGLLLVVPRRLLRLYREERMARREAEQGADAARALAHVHDAVLLLDGTGDEGAVRYWNPAAQALFGAGGDEPSLEVDRVLAELRVGVRPVPGPRPVTIGGRERWLTYAETPFDGGRVVVLRDVTDDLRLERLRADFVATAAHELRTPLAAVYGAARTLRQKEHQLSDELSAEFLDMIESESERLKVVMDQLLVSAQLDSNELPLHHERVDIADLCKSLYTSVEVRKPDGIELEVDCSAGKVCVEADSERLRQVVANLIDNAIKYSPGGGRVDLRVAERRGFGVIEVADTGLGIPPDEQQRIFEKFYRLDPAMTRGIGGSGLGLYISRELVKQMGGQLSVDSRLGEGSTFTVMLPLARAA